MTGRYAVMKKAQTSRPALFRVISGASEQKRTQNGHSDHTVEQVGRYPEGDLAAATPAPEQNPVAKAQIDALLNAFKSFESWNEPTVRRGRTFSDRDFIASLAKQHASGKVLSEKQVAALERMAAKYNLKPV